MIKFIEETHQYFVNDKELPSVTTILHSLNDFNFVNKELLDRAAKFGTAVHKATELYDKNTLNIDYLDPALMPYVDAWSNFVEDFKPKFISIEQRLSSMYGYAGTLDRYVSIRGKRMIIDIKSGTVIPKYTGLQLAAYEQALTETGEKVNQRFVVHLMPHKYKVVEFDNRLDFLVFKSALRLHQWSNEYG